MNWKNIFGKKKEEEKPYKYRGLLHLWEDDYLMMELIPGENQDFITKEINRINNFSNENFDGIGFTDITPISEKALKTINRKIPIKDIKDIFSKSKLDIVDEIVMQGEELLEKSKIPLAFGNKDFAIIIESKDALLENIWITGAVDTQGNLIEVKKCFLEFATKYNFIAVNWFLCRSYNLKIEKEIEDFLLYNE